MKYRILTSDELSHFEEDFKHFLIVNGVHNEVWEEMNKNSPEKALSLVELFSDTVLQKVYEKLEYLEFRSEESCMVFHFSKDLIELISVQRKPGADVSLISPESIQDALINHLSDLDFFTSKKEMKTNREQEIHSMIEKGCFVSDKEFWELLKEVIKD